MSEFGASSSRAGRARSAGPAPPPSGRRRIVVVAAVAVASVVLAACGGGDQGATTTSPETSPAVGETEQPVAEGGRPAPQVTLEMFDGSTRSLSDFYGDRPLIVNFWASWCPPCVAEMPDIEQVHQQLGGQVNFLGLNTQDGEQEARRLVDETGVTYPLAWDRQGELFETFGVFGMPSTFFISRDGKVVGSHTGLLTQEELERQIDEFLLDGTS